VIAGMVLAAGLSRRMGKAKLLLPLDGKPLVRWSVEQMIPHVDLSLTRFDAAKQPNRAAAVDGDAARGATGRDR